MVWFDGFRRFCKHFNVWFFLKGLNKWKLFVSSFALGVEFKLSCSYCNNYWLWGWTSVAVWRNYVTLSTCLLKVNLNLKCLVPFFEVTYDHKHVSSLKWNSLSFQSHRVTKNFRQINENMLYCGGCIWDPLIFAGCINRTVNA